MKTLLALLLLFTAAARGVEITFEWDASEPADQVAHYCLWERLPDGSVKKLVTTEGPVLTAKVNLPAGAHTIYCTGHDLQGASSEPSNELTFVIPGKPGKPRIKVTLQASDDLENWTDLVVWLDPAEERQFYRAFFDQ